VLFPHSPGTAIGPGPRHSLPWAVAARAPPVGRVRSVQTVSHEVAAGSTGGWLGLDGSVVQSCK